MHAFLIRTINCKNLSSMNSVLIFFILLGNHRFVFPAGAIMLHCLTTTSQRKRKNDEERKKNRGIYRLGISNEY